MDRVPISSDFTLSESRQQVFFKLGNQVGGREKDCGKPTAVVLDKIETWMKTGTHLQTQRQLV